MKNLPIRLEMINKAVCIEQDLNNQIAFRFEAKNTEIVFFADSDNNFKAEIDTFYINGNIVEFTQAEFDLMEAILELKHLELEDLENDLAECDDAGYDVRIEQGIYGPYY